MSVISDLRIDACKCRCKNPEGRAEHGCGCICHSGTHWAWVIEYGARRGFDVFCEPCALDPEHEAFMRAARRVSPTPTPPVERCTGCGHLFPKE